MKKLLALICILLIPSFTSIILYSYLTGEPAYPESVIQSEIHSKILNEARKLIIHLPRNYNPNRTYPVMYVLDGSSQDKHIANKIDILSTAGYVTETVIVGLPNTSGKGRQRDYTPPFMRMDLDEEDSPFGEGDKFLTFMEKELIPYIEQNYPVSEIRSLAGNSRGGLLAMYSIMYKPNLFKGRFCFSPAFWREENLIVDKVSEYLVQNNIVSSFLYLSLGDQENDKMKSGFNEMTTVLKEHAPDQLIWVSEYTKNATHRDNANISASAAIGEWSEFLKELNSSNAVSPGLKSAI